MIDSEIRKHFLAELDHSSQETQRTRLFWCDKFLQFAANKPLSEWNKSLVYGFEQKLRDEKYAGLTVRTALGVVKRVFDAAKIVHEQQRKELLTGVDIKDPESAVIALAKVQQFDSAPGPVWDLGKRWQPRAETSDITRPRLSLDEIGQMIATAKSDSLELPQVCYLALASIYALRREELCQVRREHIDFDEKTIFINTVKGGEKRKQLLCDEIVPYLKEYPFSIGYTPFMMSHMFKQILFKSGIPDQDGMGWHSFRRFGDTALRDSLASDPNLDRDAQLITKIFFRWKLTSSGEMTDRYYTADPLKADKIALAHHPVVPLWSEDLGVSPKRR